MGTFSFSFNPNDVMSLDEQSTVYPWLRVSDDWGTLEADGAMVVREQGRVTRIVVPASKSVDGAAVAGDAWKLELKPGFRIAPGARSGDQVVEKE